MWGLAEPKKTEAHFGVNRGRRGGVGAVQVQLAMCIIGAFKHGQKKSDTDSRMGIARRNGEKR